MEKEDFIYFYGYISEYSNHYNSVFVDELGRRFHNMELYLTYQKALMFRDWEIVNLVNYERNPVECLKLSRNILNFNMQE